MKIAAVSQLEPDRTERVSTLELFDLVFVLTITQLTAVLVEGARSLRSQMHAADSSTASKLDYESREATTFF